MSADNTPLDHKTDDPGNTTGYAVFGQVIGGMDVVDAIGQVPVGDDGPMPGQAPVTPILIKKVTIVDSKRPDNAPTCRRRASVEARETRDTQRQAALRPPGSTSRLVGQDRVERFGASWRRAAFRRSPGCAAGARPAPAPSR